jgi:hypothetical protein
MSELQADDSGITYDGPEETLDTSNDVEQETAEPVNGSELATDSPGEGEQNTDSATVDGVQVDGPEGFKKAIDKQHFKFREEQRRANDLEKQLQDLKTANKPAPIQNVVVPPIPESWDENYEQKIKERDEAIMQSARNEAIQSQQSQATAQQEQTRQVEQARVDQKRNEDFVANADKLGVNRESLTAASSTVINYGISPEIANAIITDANGPLIIQHLASNPLDLYELTNGNAFTAGQKWSEIKASSVALKPKTSNAPKPTTKVNGKGAPAKERGVQGTIYE